MCSFCWLGNIPLYVYHSYFIHSFVDGRLGCFHVLAIRNSAAMNIGVHMSFSILVASGYMPRSGIAGSCGVLFLVFQGISILSSELAVSINIPTTVQEGSLFSTLSPAFIVCRCFDDGHSEWLGLISHCSFDLHFSNNE